MARSAFQFELKGARQLENALRQLPKATSKSVLRSALKKAAKPVVDEAQRLAPVDSGLLVESTEAKTTLAQSQQRGRGKPGAVTLYIGPTKAAGHGHLVEFGTSHSAPQPFMRPAWDAHKDQVLASLSDEIWASLARTARRLAKQAGQGKLSASARRSLGG